VRKFTNGRFAQNSYLLGDQQSRVAALVDPGEDPSGLLAEVTRGGWRVEAIWLTHAHIDHVLGVPQARRLTSAPVLLHGDDLPLYANVPQQATAMGFSATALPAPDGELTEGQSLAVLEALSEGTPVIVSPLPANRELHERHPEHVVFADGPEAVPAALASLTGAAVAKPAIPTWDDVAAELEVAYRSLTR